MMTAGCISSGCKALHGFLTKTVRRQLILGIALVHGVLMTGFVLDLVSRQQAFLHQQSIKQATSLAEALAANCVSWMLSDDLAGLAELVDSLKNTPGLEYIMVVDDRCRVLAHSAREHMGMYLQDQTSLGLLGGGATTRILNRDQNLIDIAAPVLANDKSIGWARVSINQSDQLSGLALVTRKGIIYTLVAILIGTALAVLISKRLTLGLANLVRLSAKVQAGLRDMRADEQRNDEIGSLGRGFNRMLESIENSEKKLLDSLNWKRTILDTSAVGILVVSPNRIVQEANARFFAMFGYEPEEFIGKSTEALHVSHESFLAFERNIPGFATQQDTVDTEYQFQTKSGVLFWCLISGRPIDPTDLEKGVIWVLVDITERKLAEEERARFNAALEAKNAELEQVVYVTSHDLRSPLVNIEGYSKELGIAIESLRQAISALPLDEKTILSLNRLIAEDISESLRFIHTSSSKMEALLDGLLRLSRSGRHELAIMNLDMNTLVSNIIESTGFKIKEAGIRLEVSKLPPCRGDLVQVTQVFSNILDNAVKFLDPNRPGIIRISGRPEPKRSVYCVEDNGIGIARNHLNAIFEIFHRIDPSRCNGEGLGLTIVRRMLGRQGGEVWVESEEGSGSRFYVALPATEPEGTQ